MNLQATKGTLENANKDEYIKIDMRQLEEGKKYDLVLFGEKVTLERSDVTPFAKIVKWYLNGKKVVSVGYTNK